MVGGRTTGIRMTGIWMIGMIEGQAMRIEVKGKKEVGERLDQVVEMEAEEEV